jgi:hypothetical protein
LSTNGIFVIVEVFNIATGITGAASASGDGDQQDASGARRTDIDGSGAAAAAITAAVVTLAQSAIMVSCAFNPGKLSDRMAAP